MSKKPVSVTAEQHAILSGMADEAGCSIADIASEVVEVGLMVGRVAFLLSKTAEFEGLTPEYATSDELLKVLHEVMPQVLPLLMNGVSHQPAIPANEVQKAPEHEPMFASNLARF